MSHLRYHNLLAPFPRHIPPITQKRYLFPGHNTHPLQAPAHHHHRHSSPWNSPRHFPGKPGLAKNKSVNAIKQGTYCLHTVAILQGLLVLSLKANLLAKTPWSWRRMHDFSSAHFLGEARDRIPSPTLRERDEKRERELREFGNETKKARPRTTSDARARSKKLKT